MQTDTIQEMHVENVGHLWRETPLYADELCEELLLKTKRLGFRRFFLLVLPLFLGLSTVELGLLAESEDNAASSACIKLPPLVHSLYNIL